VSEKHTPGPWVWNNHLGLTDFSKPTPNYLFLRGPEAPYEIIVDKDGTKWGPNPSDALLIARAPDLLEVCKEALAFVRTCIHSKPRIIHLTDIRDRLRKEIFKAEGIE